MVRKTYSERDCVCQTTVDGSLMERGLSSCVGLHNSPQDILRGTQQQASA